MAFPGLVRPERRAADLARFYELFYRWSISLPVIASRSHHHRHLNRRRHSMRLSCNSQCHIQCRKNSNFASALTSSSSPEDLTQQMRHLMRLVAHPIVVITTLMPTASSSKVHGNNNSSSCDDPRDFRAMTVSSLNTVCLQPIPVVSFNIKTPSATYDALRANGGFFLAHFLSATSAGARAADGLTRGVGGVTKVLGPVRKLEGGGVAMQPEDEKQGLQTYAGEETRGAPMMIGPAVLQVVGCRVLEGKEVTVGDHVVLCAEVERLYLENDRSEMQHEEGLGLVYVDRAFRQVGADITWEENADGK